MDKKEEYKQKGFIAQKQAGFYAMRIRTRGGNMSSAQLYKVAELADKYGQGQIHFTTRQAVEMCGVPEDFYTDIAREIMDAGLLPAVCGPRVRTIVACPGSRVCRFGIADTTTLAEQLDQLFVGTEVPSKTKLNISGCPNSCAKPQESDLGLQGVVIPRVQAGCVGCGACTRVCKVKAIAVADSVPIIDRELCVCCGLCVRACPKQALVTDKQGYNVFAGGKIGRQPGLGTKMFTAVGEQEAVRYIDALIRAYRLLARKGERISQTLARVGKENFISAAQAEAGKLYE